MDNSWIKLYRKILKDALWKDCTSNQKVVMITLLLMADHKENEWIFKGERYKTSPGEFVTSLKSIVENSGVSIKVVRNSLEKLESLGFLISKSSNKNRIIKIKNWEKYQGQNLDKSRKNADRAIKGHSSNAVNNGTTEDGSCEEGNQRASKGQSKGNQRATNKNIRMV